MSISNKSTSTTSSTSSSRLNPSIKKKILIVGGVAGGASCAARLRRLDESAEIVIFERGPYVSFANCGLPYYVGEVIKDESKLLLANPELFKNRFNIEVRTECEVTSIHRNEKKIQVRDLKRNQLFDEEYDFLVLSPGASPIRPPLSGIDLPGIFVVRTIPDSRAVREWILSKKAKSALVVGGGFIGLEMAENLVHRGLQVRLLELQKQIMAPLDPEMAQVLQEVIVQKGIQVSLGEGAQNFELTKTGKIQVKTNLDHHFEADLVVLAIGVKPETHLAKESGLKIGERGGIWVDEQMRTNDPFIFAVGDAIEVKDAFTGQASLLPLAGPANRQGRLVADIISCCLKETEMASDNKNKFLRFRGTQGTAICGLFGMAAAATGLNEKSLTRLGTIDYEKIWLYPNHHVGYYPGAKRLYLKLLFQKSDGLILGFQALGEEDVARKVDVISMAMQKKATVFDLEESELCYSPQFGAAKDPINFAGMIASNHLRGDFPLANWNDLNKTKAVIVDVREPHEFSKGQIQKAINIPLHEIRKRIGQDKLGNKSEGLETLLDRSQEIWVHCEVGLRGHYAARLLMQNGYNVKNLSGGYQTYIKLKSAGLI